MPINQENNYYNALPVSRRSFLKYATAYAGSLILSNLNKHDLAFARPKKKIIVIGAGFAGLAAAFELSQKGQEVFVIEARNRVGGRVQTIRDFEDGQYAEGGAEFISHSEKTILKYLEDFKLQTINITGANYLFKDNKLSLLRDVIGAAREKFSEAKKKPADKLPLEEPFRGNFAKRIDKLTIKQFLDNKGFSENEQSLIDLLIELEYGVSMDKISLLISLIDYTQPYADEQLRVVGGNDQLATAFLNELNGNNVFLNSKVTQINYLEEPKIEVTFKDATNGRGRSTIKGDFLIIAIPFTVLTKIKFVPSLPIDLASAIKKLPYSTIVKVINQFETRFYKKDVGLDFEILTSFDNTAFWEPTGNQIGEKGILTAYTPGVGGLKVSNLTDANKTKDVLNKLDQIFPNTEKKIITSRVVDRVKDPFSKGAFSYFPPGYLTRYWNFLLKPFRKIFFAGEHTSLILGQTMNGALMSGQRAASKVLEAISEE